MSLDFLRKDDLKDVLKEVMKKQFEDLHADFEKTQLKLITKMKKVVQDEIRHITQVQELSSVPTVAPHEDTKDSVRKEKKGRTLSTRLSSYDANPFKGAHAKINDADDFAPETKDIPIFLNEASASEVAFPPEKDLGKRDLQIMKVEEPAENDASAESATEAKEDTRTNPSETDVPLLKPEVAIARRGQNATKVNYMELLQNPIIEGVIVCLVILNALWIGAELEYKLTVSMTRPVYFECVDILFCALFSFELLCRIYVSGPFFFDATGAQCIWNYLDVVLVLSQIAELLFRFFDIHENVNDKALNVSWLRVLRILRIVRLTRIVRTVRFIEGLRNLMNCLFRGLTATGWITFFLLMQIYTCSLAFTELIHEMRVNHNHDFEKGGEVDLQFGSLSSTMGTLCKSITGGISWGDAAESLNEISSPLGFVFVIYVSFSLLVILNIFTGFFVNTSTLCADEDGKKMLRDRLADVFVVDEKDQYRNTVDEEFFTERVNSPEMKAYFNQIDLHVDEAEGLFKILDLDGKGELDPIQTVSGLMRMRGNAKALDVRMLMYAVTKIQEYNHGQLKLLEDKLVSVQSSLQNMQKETTDSVGDAVKVDRITVTGN